MEIYISCDIEADGPIPGNNSMLSLGSAAFRDNKLVDMFSVNLELLEGATQDEKTMREFWNRDEKNKAAYAATRVDVVDPTTAMQSFVDWVRRVSGRDRPVFVGYPVTYDFMFVYWYMMRFVGESPFSFSALDIKTMAMIMLNKDFRSATKRNMPRRWFSKSPHTHVAVDDAIEQGEMFCNMMKELRGR